MTKSWLKAGISVLCAAIIFTGCGYQQGATGNNQGNNGVAGANQAGTAGTMNQGIFDANNNYYDGLLNANRNDGGGIFGNWTGNAADQGNRNGMTIMGNGRGISSEIEAHMNRNQTGRQNTRVLVLGDTVIVGQGNDQGNARTTNRGKTSGINNTNTNNAGANRDGNTMNVANIQHMFGGGVRVMTVTNQHALEAMDRVKWNLNANPSSETLVSDIRTILNNAIATDQQRGNGNNNTNNNKQQNGTR
jgi:hypothetical protein